MQLTAMLCQCKKTFHSSSIYTDYPLRVIGEVGANSIWPLKGWGHTLDRLLIHYRSSTQFRAVSCSNPHVFGVWEETGAPWENPCKLHTVDLKLEPCCSEATMQPLHHFGKKMYSNLIMWALQLCSSKTTSSKFVFVKNTFTHMYNHLIIFIKQIIELWYRSLTLEHPRQTHYNRKDLSSR